MHAATLIATHLGDLMVRQLGQKIEILDQYQLSGDQSSVNLICLGGPDVNIITRQLLHEINPSIKPISFINNDPNDLHFIDTLTGNVLPSDAQFVPFERLWIAGEGSKPLESVACGDDHRWLFWVRHVGRCDSRSLS